MILVLYLQEVRWKKKRTPPRSFRSLGGDSRSAQFILDQLTAKLILTTAVISLSIVEVSYIPESETSVESAGVICKTPIFAERTDPIELPVLAAIFSARTLASLAASPSISIFKSPICV